MLQHRIIRLQPGTRAGYVKSTMAADDPKPRALITPSVLAWARREAGLDQAVAARKLGVKPERLIQWEVGEELPTIRQLLELGRVYKRNPAVFYLPVPPAEAPPVHDFRRLAGVEHRPLSPELRYEIRLAFTRRDILLDLMGDGFPAAQLPHIPDLEADPERAAATIRERLGVSVDDQRGWRNPDLALRRWRGAIERIGILVFQTTRVDIGEMRGFSSWHGRLPVVLINGADVPPARCFSALHELCHLILRDGGLCLTGEDGGADNPEIICNRVAGATLVPAANLLGEQLVMANAGNQIWSDDQLRNLARTYSVSQEMILRRLLILGRTTERFYRQKRQEFIDEQHAHEERNRSGYAPPHAVALNRVGRLYARAVLDGFHEGRVSPSDLARYLGLKLRHLRDFEAAVYAA
jgi:Zn-dependent peptidase ImmA (M78 family)/DNA-binding transcriptional regulator YiaG